jgi:hypothetical protein
VGGTCGGALAENTYTTNAVTGDCTVIASFASSTFTVTPSVSGGNGTITPATPRTVSYNMTVYFTVTPDAGYHIDTVSGTCGGTLAGDIYTTSAITADCTVAASFAINTYTITATADAGGSISCIPSLVDHGSFILYDHSGSRLPCGGHSWMV